MVTKAMLWSRIIYKHETCLHAGGVRGASGKEAIIVARVVHVGAHVGAQLAVEPLCDYLGGIALGSANDGNGTHGNGDREQAADGFFDGALDGTIGRLVRIECKVGVLEV